jgi:hypothetical protein
MNWTRKGSEEDECKRHLNAWIWKSEFCIFNKVSIHIFIAYIKNTTVWNISVWNITVWNTSVW